MPAFALQKQIHRAKSGNTCQDICIKVGTALIIGYLWQYRDSPDSPDIRQNRETPDNRTIGQYRDSPIKCI
nr:MAG TPA: hypothetical protein [Caudoviricetes sp.]